MTTTLNPHGRSHTRARSIAKVKFVMLPIAGEAEPAAMAAAPMQSQARFIFSTLRAIVLRVIDRLKAARP